MHINIQAQGFPLTEALRRHAERRLHYALAHNNQRICRVIMRLSDVSGSHGGQDKRCHLRVVVTGIPNLVTEDTEADLYDAINRATSRAGRALTRKLSRPSAGPVTGSVPNETSSQHRRQRHV